MTVLDFRNLVFALCKTEGTPYLKITETAALTDLCQEMLNVYASKTHCLRSDRVSFTPVVSQSVYSTFTTPQSYGQTTVPTYLGAALCFVAQVFIEGAALKVLGDGLGRSGPSDEGVVIETYPNYLAGSNSRPIAWWQAPPNTIKFNCPFDQVYASCYLSGRLYHTPLTSDTQVLDLPPEDIEPAAMLAAIRLLRPYNREKALELQAVAERGMLARFAECSEKDSGPSQRGSLNPRFEMNIRGGGARR